MASGKAFDVIVIGGGVVGCAIARELARYSLDCAVLEKESDVARGISSANSGVVHSGVNNRPGTLMAQLCVEGNRSFAQLCRELSVPYRKSGKLIVARTKKERSHLEFLQKQGKKNAVAGLEMIGSTALRRMEPNVHGESALHSPETAITSPYLLTIALAENASMNGVEFFLGARVLGIALGQRGFELNTSRGGFRATWVVNSAGLYADEVARMVGIDDYEIYPCRGEYQILDKQAESIIDRPVYPVPRQEAGGLGVHLTPSVAGNVLLGPSSEYIAGKGDTATTRRVMDLILRESMALVPAVRPKDVICSFAGVRPKLTPPSAGGYADFVVEESRRLPRFVNLIGIESPGLTAAVPLARRVVGIIERRDRLTRKPSFVPTRNGPVKFAEQSLDVKAELIEQDPYYGEIVCRCEQITKKEVLQAIRGPLGARDLAAIKYRVRAMMGRCQGGYCMPRLVELLRVERGLEPQEVGLRGPGSPVLVGYRAQGRNDTSLGTEEGPR